MIVVENGTIIDKNLAKIRLTVDMLEVRLRQQGVQNISDLQWATIESNGQIGYLLKPEKQYATKEDIQKLLALFQANEQNITNSTNNLFTEVKNKIHKEEPPTHLK
ncbi:YetF domain-containing protein [Sutcliffiella cohnii]